MPEFASYIQIEKFHSFKCINRRANAPLMRPTTTIKLYREDWAYKICSLCFRELIQEKVSKNSSLIIRFVYETQVSHFYEAEIFLIDSRRL